MRSIKLSFIMAILFFSVSFGQALDCDVPHPVYEFLSRAYNLNMIKEFDNFHLPLQRKYLSGKLREYLANNNLLSEDRKVAELYLIELDKDYVDSLKQSYNLIAKEAYPFSENTKRYFFSSYKKNEGNVSVNLVGELKVITNENKTATLGSLGGIIEGSIHNSFGFYLFGTNGKLFGNKTAAYYEPSLKYNYKFNESAQQTFFDDTRGYLTYSNDFLKIKLGRDIQEIGYGFIKPLLDSNHPTFDYFSIAFDYSFFSYDAFTGKLLGSMSGTSWDSIQGTITKVEEKYIGYNRMQFNFSPSTKLGVGEYIIYSRRPMDLSYINPLIFHKSIEHSNQDRDNSMLFVDLSTRAYNSQLRFLLLLDDLDYSKLGTGWYGNQTIIQTGISYYGLNPNIPADLHFDYIEIQPYVFSHRINENNFSTFGYMIGFPLQPNSRMVSTKINYHPNPYLMIELDYLYGKHGKNIKDSLGNVIQNVGGDFRVGYRINDPQKVFLLDGDKETLQRFALSIRSEYIKDIVIMFNLMRGNLDFTSSKLTEQTKIEFGTILKF